MYSGVPTTAGPACGAASSAGIQAKPKSSSLTASRPLASCTRKMFSGFTSRWTMPAACAAPSPSAAPATTRTARGPAITRS
jgi:hypothetical protein